MSDPWAEIGFEPDPPAQQQPQGGPLEQFASQLATGDFSQVPGTLYDGAVGLSQGASMGGADELMGAMPGTSVDEQRAIRDAAKARSPMAYDAGNAAGSLIPAALTSGGSALEQFAQALLQGGAGGFLGSDGTPEQRAQSGAVGAGVGGALSGAGSAIGALAKPLRSMADAERAAAISTPGDFATLARKEGLPYTQTELAQQAERMGLANRIIPQSAAGYAQKAGAVRDAAGQQIGNALDTASNIEGAHGYLDPIAQGLQSIASQGAANRSSLGAPREAVANDLLSRLGPVDGTMVSPLELFALKKQYEEAGGYVPDDIKNLPTGQGPIVNQQAAGLARNELGNAMGLATPETRQAFDTANREYAYAATIQNLAREKAIQDAKPLGTMGTVGSAGLGGAIGGIPGAIAGYGAGKLARSYGHDALANGLRMADPLAAWGGDAIAASGGPLGQDAGQMAAAEQPIEKVQQQRERSANRSMGQNLQSVVEGALDTDPASLGQYAPQLQQAYQSGDPMAITAALYELERDQTFRTTVLPQLQHATNQTGDY